MLDRMGIIGSGIGAIIMLTIGYFIFIQVDATITMSEIENNNPNCVLDLKENYCSKFNMELFYKIIVPTGFFAGPPYENGICVGEKGEKIIDLDYIDYKKCEG